MNGNKTEEYKFVKVEDFFNNYKNWDSLDKVESYHFDEDKKTLSLSFNRSKKTCTMLLHFLRKDILRKRFSPDKASADDFPAEHNRTIIMDTVHHLRDVLDDFTLQCKKTQAGLELITQEQDNKFLKLHVNFEPFNITIFRFRNDGSPYKILSDTKTPIYFQKSSTNEYSIIQASEKPPTAKYIGFGEKGSSVLCKNTTQLTYFNFDNMRYKQIYSRNCLDGREPLYHTDPFFMEFYGDPEERSVYGIFSDNPSETFIDLGYLNSNRYMIGSLFGDLDYYIFVGDNCADITEAYTSIVGTSRLKPRYALGFHQGCYGYDTREKVIDVADTYRKYEIPIDGIHIDVDIQYKYQTFTVYDEKYGDENPPFPDPKGMFDYLRKKGFKCSTNITPIISNLNTEGSAPYLTYKEAAKQGFLVEESRSSDDIKENQCYSDGNKWESEGNRTDIKKGEPYVGEVWYGGDRGTSGCYADLGRKEVQKWWGEQYKYLFETGLEMVWQDMTTPAIRDTRGDMKSFPFNLLVTNNFQKKYTGESVEDSSTVETGEYEKSPAIKIRNLYSYNLHKATYHGLNHLECRKNKRNFIVGRGGFSGMHRFAALWTGDNASTWEFLQISVAQALALGVSGQAMSGQDIGGFEQNPNGGVWADPELLIRWTVAGAFLPWFRNHYIAKGVKLFQEPFNYMKVIDRVPEESRYMYEAVLPVCKHYISLRYRLMQLFYDAMFENTINGMPISRAMFLSDHEDDALFNDKLEFLNNQFFLRNDLLIAPIVEKQSQNNLCGKRDVYLPEYSDWYNFLDNTKPLAQAIEGGSTISDYDASINLDKDHLGFILPMYVRAGAIIPTIELEQYVGESKDQGRFNPVTLNIYPGESGSYTMYLDDGVSRSSAPTENRELGGDPAAKSEYREVKVNHAYTDPKSRLQRRIIINQLNYSNYDPVKEINDEFGTDYKNFYFIALLHDPLEKIGASGCIDTVKIVNKKAPLISKDSTEAMASSFYSSPKNAWYYNEKINISFIKVFDTAEKIELDVTYIK